MGSEADRPSRLLPATDLSQDKKPQLSSQRIRLYNRVVFQRDMLKTVYANWFDDLAAIGAFRVASRRITNSLNAASQTASI